MLGLYKFFWEYALRGAYRFYTQTSSQSEIIDNQGRFNNQKQDNRTNFSNMLARTVFIAAWLVMKRVAERQATLEAGASSTMPSHTSSSPAGYLNSRILD